MRRFFLVFALVLCGFFKTNVVLAEPGSDRCNEASDIGNIGCDSGTLYKCKCKTTLYGSCILTDWYFYTDCNVGACRSSTKCAQCTTTSYPDSCSNGVLSYCNSSKLKDSVTCTYGCRSGTACAQCRASDNKGCKLGDVCLSGVCRTPVDGECSSANNTSRSTAPGASSRCNDGTATAVVSTPNTTRIKYDGWEWSCKGIYGGSDANCQAYISCQKYALNSGYDKGTCESNSRCIDVFAGHMYTKTFDCAFAGGGCCMYDTSLLECSPEGAISNCRECIWDGPGISHWEPIGTEGEDGVCEDINRSYCSYSLIPKCKTGYGVVDNDKVASDGRYNWTCKGQAASGCRSAGTSVTCSAAKGSAAVSSCGGAVDKIYSTGSDPENIPANSDLCGENNTSDWDCANCDSDGFDGTLNWTCTGDCNTPVNCSAENDVPPVPVIPPPIYVPDGSSPAVTVDTSGRSHICQPEFGGIKLVGWRVTATDINGVADIGTILLRLVGAKTYTTDPVQAINGTANIVIDTSNPKIDTGTYDVEVLVNDVDGGVVGTWVDTGRDFRVWDCLVSVSGRFYDGSGQTVSCSAGSGYTNTIPSAATFSMAYYLGSGAPRNMNVTSPNFASGDKLYWNTSVAYQPVFTDFPGADPTEMRINGSTCVSGISLDPKAYVDPYVDNPSMTIDYSSVLDQDAWFSVTSGSVISKAKISNYIPVTCNTENCQTSVGGVVWSKGRSTLSTYDQVSNQRRMNEKSLELKDVSYRYFFDNYFSKLGIGVTVGSSKNWSEIASLTGILLIKGNLLIDQNITGTEMRVIGVSGDITIDPSVKQINAVLFGRNVSVGGTSSDQLQINGSIYSSGSVTLNRSFTDKSKNNITPAVKVNYDPSILFKMPKEVSKSVTQWRMN